MARPAPAVVRAVRLVDLLVSHPTERFTLSELARRTGVGLGSVHAVLTELEDAGYLSRHPIARTYSLGPALVVAGAVALEQQPALGLAKEEIDAVAAALGVEALVTAPTTHEIVFVARAGRASPRSPTMLVGERVPLVPPLGAVFMAWASASEIDAWLARAPAAGGTELVARSRADLALARARGFSIGSASETQRAFGATVFSLADAPRRRELRADLDMLLVALAADDYAVASIDPARIYDIGMIAAPVFDGDGRVVAAIAATGFSLGLRAPDVVRAAERIRDAAAVVTKRMGGRPTRGG
jgi:DNA-binding IclR family transcriptional regulator